MVLYFFSRLLFKNASEDSIREDLQGLVYAPCQVHKVFNIPIMMFEM